MNVKRIRHDPPGYVYAPDAIATLLMSLGADLPEPPSNQPEYSKHAQELVALLERVARVYQRTTILYDKDERHNQAILSSPHWPELRSLLILHGVISGEERETKGANVTGYRVRANPDEMLSSDPAEGHSSTAGLWKALQTL